MLLKSLDIPITGFKIIDDEHKSIIGKTRVVLVVNG